MQSLSGSASKSIPFKISIRRKHKSSVAALRESWSLNRVNNLTYHQKNKMSLAFAAALFSLSHSLRHAGGPSALSVYFKSAECTFHYRTMRCFIALRIAPFDLWLEMRLGDSPTRREN